MASKTKLGKTTEKNDFNEGGDIVFVELPEVGAQLKRGDVMGTVESVKAVSELYSPVSGEVTETNAALGDTPEMINEDPHVGGWICKIRIADSGELDALMDAAAYQELTES